MDPKLSAPVAVASPGSITPPASLGSSTCRVPRVAALVLSALLVVAVPAAAARTRTGSFWATVNICDSPGEPDSMGVRAGMSGTGRLQRMYTRFRAQYWSADRWHPVRGSTSPWINLGLARVRSEQVGWTFAFSTPAAGTL